MARVRAAVHVHSNWSFDGTWDLPSLAKALKRRGYDVILTAEHSQSLDADRWRQYRDLCTELTTDSLLVVPGIEYRDADNVVHIPTWGDLPHLGDRVDVGTLVARVDELGGAAILAHPGRHQASLNFEASWATHLVGIETWNRKYDGWRPNAEAFELASLWGVGEIASLDFHRRRQFHPLATVIDAQGPATAESVVEALRSGRFRAQFLGMPVEGWTTGRRAAVLKTTDSIRSRTASTLRRLRSG